MKDVCLVMRVKLVWIFVLTACLYGADVEEPLIDDCQVRVVYLPMGGDCCSAWYDVAGATVCKTFEAPEKPVVIIQPVLDALKDEYLRGFCQKWLCLRRPTITQAKLSLQEADLTCYKPCHFESEFLRAFLMKDIPKLHTWGKVCFERGFQELQSNAFADLITEWKVLQWSVEKKEALEKDVQEYPKKCPIVYICVRGEKVLKGVLKFGLLSSECYLDNSTLLSHKLSDTWTQLEKIYSYSLEKHYCCINYTGAVPLGSIH